MHFPFEISICNCFHAQEFRTDRVTMSSSLPDYSYKVAWSYASQCGRMHHACCSMVVCITPVAVWSYASRLLQCGRMHHACCWFLGECRDAFGVWFACVNASMIVCAMSVVGFNPSLCICASLCAHVCAFVCTNLFAYIYDRL